MQEVAERTAGAVRLSPSTLFSAVKRLLEQGFGAATTASPLREGGRPRPRQASSKGCYRTRAPWAWRPEEAEPWPSRAHRNCESFASTAGSWLSIRPSFARSAAASCVWSSWAAGANSARVETGFTRQHRLAIGETRLDRAELLAGKPSVLRPMPASSG
jgi:hypothetical protein